MKTRRMPNDVVFKKISKRKKKKQQQEREKEKKKQQDLAVTLAKLEQLRRLRVKKLRSEGKSPVDINYLSEPAPPETDPLTDLSTTNTTNVTNETTETTSTKSTITNDGTTETRSAKSTKTNDTTTETTSAKSTNTTNAKTNSNVKSFQTMVESDTTNVTKHESYDNPRLYYYRAYESLDNLIEIRRGWDKYLVTPGSGSRIPQHFIAPPQAPEGSPWRNFVVVKKSKPTTTTDDTNGMTTDPANKT